MPMDTMIEMVRKAIRDEYEKGDAGTWLDRAATAAIRAMSEPTEECWEVAREIFVGGHGIPNMREVYRTVIDAALTTPEREPG